MDRENPQRPVNEETMSSAMAQKLIERLSRWRREA
jgi:hypothetical protein